MEPQVHQEIVARMGAKLGAQMAANVSLGVQCDQLAYELQMAQRRVADLESQVAALTPTPVSEPAAPE